MSELMSLNELLKNIENEIDITIKEKLNFEIKKEPEKFERAKSFLLMGAVMAHTKIKEDLERG